MKRKSLSLLMLSSALFFSSSAQAEKVLDIRVTGNKRVEKSTILNYIKLKKGEEYSFDKERQSFSDLYNTYLFDNIKISHANGVVDVVVAEMPLVVKVLLSGNSRVKTATIEREIATHKGASLNSSSIRADVEKIKEIYQKSGRYAVKVDATITKEENDRAIVTFNIIEGPKTGVRYINFVGNTSYRDSELRSVIVTKQSAWFRFMDTSDTYDPDRMEYDKYLLKRFYNSLGYADFRTISATAELSKTKENFTLTYVVDEGVVYEFGEISIKSSLQDISASKFSDIIKVKKGQRYNALELERIVDAINAKLADEGYSGIYVYPDEEKDRDNKIINVKIVIEKGSKTLIDRINITGNLKTRDHVIRRQFKINESDLFSRSSINKGEQNIRNLDYFETVSIDVEESEKKNKANVNVKVEEKSTSSIQFEVGYNTMEGAVGRLNFIERNLLGTGRYLTAGIDRYTKKTSYHMGLIDPYFMDRDLLVGGDFFKSVAKSSSEVPYNITALGADVKAAYDIATDLRHDIVYLIKQDKLTGGTGPVSSSPYISEQYGTYYTSSLSNSVTYDQTDSVIVPKNGYILSATETVAGLGGDVKYMKHEGDFKIFKSFSNNDYTLKFSGEVGKIQGYGGQKVRLSDRFMLGDFSFRGFESSGIGPRTKVGGIAMGGQNYYKLTSELLFPIGFPKEFNVSGAVFSDIGALWGVDIRSSSLYKKSDIYDTTAPRMSAGVGIVWVTRFAPIRIDYAIPIKREKYDVTQRWHFRFSTSF